MPGGELFVLNAQSCLIFTTTLWSGYKYKLYFTYEETVIHRVVITCPSLHSSSMVILKIMSWMGLNFEDVFISLASFLAQTSEYSWVLVKITGTIAVMTTTAGTDPTATPKFAQKVHGF